MSKKSTVFENFKLEPEDTLFFAGFVVQAPVPQIEKIKKVILSEEKCRLIYQHKDVRYLKIVPAEAMEK